MVGGRARERFGSVIFECNALEAARGAQLARTRRRLGIYTIERVERAGDILQLCWPASSAGARVELFCIICLTQERVPPELVRAKVGYFTCSRAARRWAGLFFVCRPLSRANAPERKPNESLVADR